MRLLEFGLMVAALGVPAAAQTYVTFDPPGSTYTVPYSINSAASITGLYIDSRERAFSSRFLSAAAR
jgi:hypothetical protein